MATKGTSVAKAKGTSVAMAQTMAQEVEDLRSRLAAPSGDKVKIDNKQFKLPNGDTSDMLSGIIVDFVYYNAFYSGPYDANNIVPPECFSISPNPTDGVPSANAPDVQHTECATCPQNQFGSAGKGKACRNSVMLAMLPPDATEDTPLIIVNVSPTGIRPYSSYVSAVARTFQRPPYGVITDIVCDPNLKYDSLRFGNPQPVDGDLLDLVRSRREEARARLMVEPDVSALKAANDGKPKSKLAAPKKPAGKRAA